MSGLLAAAASVGELALAVPTHPREPRRHFHMGQNAQRPADDHYLRTAPAVKVGTA